MHTQGQSVTFNLDTSGITTGKLVMFKNIYSSGTITINLAGTGYTIEGTTSYSLSGAFSCATFMLSQESNHLLVVSKYN